jgi:protein-tyrosine phosphatase
MAKNGMKRDRDIMEGQQQSKNSILPLPATTLQSRLDVIRKYVARPIPMHDPNWTDPQPALVEGGCVLIGNKYHAADVENLLSLGVTAVLNCASGGISRLPVDQLKESGIGYTFTNVKRDDYDYPILHDSDNGVCSQHLEIAKTLYGDVRREGGKVLFFCVAGQNRSAALSMAVMMLYGHSLEACLQSCTKDRPFVLENVGFQRQLVELEAILASPGSEKMTLHSTLGGGEMFLHGTPPPKKLMVRSKSAEEMESKLVEVELLIPGVCTMEVKIPVECTIPEVKRFVESRSYSLTVYRRIQKK